MSAIAQTAHRSSAGGIPKAQDRQETYFNNYDTRPFALVSQNLAQIGSIPLEQFLSAKTVDPDRQYEHMSTPQNTTRTRGGVSSPDPSKNRDGPPLAPINGAEISGYDVEMAPNEEYDPAVKEIEDCCRECRAGRVHPHWVSYNERKPGSYGYALRIELSPHFMRVYSTDTIHDGLLRAKQACAKSALEQGVLEFIKFGNGQKQPATPTDPTSDEKVETTLAPIMSLQSFYETLPQPFSEPVGDKPAAEINAHGWLCNAMQSVKGAKLSSKFIWISGKGVHGCLLRLESPQGSMSYLVDAGFSKRRDAKAAVCLQAMSQGVGKYIESIRRELGNKVRKERDDGEERGDAKRKKKGKPIEDELEEGEVPAEDRVARPASLAGPLNTKKKKGSGKNPHVPWFGMFARPAPLERGQVKSYAVCGPYSLIGGFPGGVPVPAEHAEVVAAYEAFLRSVSPPGYYPVPPPDLPVYSVPPIPVPENNGYVSQPLQYGGGGGAAPGTASFWHERRQSVKRKASDEPDAQGGQSEGRRVRRKGKKNNGSWSGENGGGKNGQGKKKKKKTKQPGASKPAPGMAQGGPATVAEAESNSK